MAEVQKYSMVSALKKSDIDHDLDPSVLGMSMLTSPQYVNGTRTEMFTSHLKQLKCLNNPEVPLIYMGGENTVGRNNSSYKKAPDVLVVHKIVRKYEDLVDNPFIATIFLYNKTTKTYSVMIRKECENLTENFGYLYDNSVIDSKDEGDEIQKGDVYCKSVSYDDYMNYGYGKNVVTIYSTDPYTAEDAAVISESLANSMLTIETEKIRFEYNGNDYPLNLYGKGKDYKPLPDIGEYSNGYITVSRRLRNDQVLYDFAAESLSKIHPGDTRIFSSSKDRIIDYEIYNNNDETVNNPFTKQTNRFLRSQTKYYKEIRDICDDIMKSGDNYSLEIEHMYKRANDMISTDAKWRKSSDSTFSGIVIEVTVLKICHLTVGQKISGRYGNKSVISEIRPDNEMPFTEDGRRVDLILHVLAIVNRTTAFPPYEIMMNSINHEVIKKMYSYDNYVDREKLLFDIIYEFNEEEYRQMKGIYDSLSIEEQKDFIDDTMREGIRIHQPSIWESKPIFFRIRDILEKYPWIQPSAIYNNKWGRKIKSLSKQWVGEMYIIVLKQSGKRGYSARSTGAINERGLPTRSYKSRSHQDRYSETAIRFGEFETLEIWRLYAVMCISETS